jgi:hypothetical protein
MAVLLTARQARELLDAPHEAPDASAAQAEVIDANYSRGAVSNCLQSRNCTRLLFGDAYQQGKSQMMATYMELQNELGLSRRSWRRW